MPKPAEILLRPGSGIHAAWAVFDAGWYGRSYPEAAVAWTEAPDAALDYYLNTGCRLGHSPSPLFDEIFYLASNPGIVALIEAGHYRSGFDHFCQHGHRGLSPHWLFDDALYDNLYEDMALDNLDRFNCYGRYDHYLKSGQRETRIAHFLFDNRLYRERAIAAGADAAEIDRLGPYVHYLYRLSGAGELACSAYFEPGWYRERYPAAKAEIAAGRYCAALHHYLINDTQVRLDPVPEFSENFYLSAYADVAAGVEAGQIRNGYRHFVQHGAFELRRPRTDIDLIYYRDMSARVRDDLNSGTIRDAFVHLRLVGLAENLPYCPPEQLPDIAEPTAKQLFLLRARNMTALYARHRLDFTPGPAPDLSVVMVLHNQFALTMTALAALRDHYSGGIELILIDNASTDDTSRIGVYAGGATIIRNPNNHGFLRACNQGLAKAAAPAVLFLNNDTELGHGSIAAALRRLGSAADIGAVGGKIIRTHGRLQEAGSIIWANGTTTGYLRDASPLAPEANFVRDVDYCSGVFLLCRTGLVKRLGGFDEAFSPAYYEEVDLCIRMAEAGFRVVYDPAVVVHHLEYGSAANTEASMMLMRRGRGTFRRKHQEFLSTKFERSPEILCKARSLNADRRILFLEDTIPLRRLGSGFVRANDAVRAMAEAGYQVSVLPINGARHDIMSLFGDLPETVEVLHDRNILTLPALLRERPGCFDLIWISRTHNLGRILPILAEAGIDPHVTPLILDTEAVESARDQAAAALHGVPFDLDAALASEFANAGCCRHITAVNQAEADRLSGIGLPSVSVLGTIREPVPTPRGFSDREGMLLIASIHQMDSPNLDSLRWYANEILPALARLMAPVPKLTFIGYTAPGIDLSEFASNPHIALRSMADDTAPAYDSHRIFVAPTRYAAGTPYKLYEAASFGIPCVATDLLLRQLGWVDDAEMLGALVDDAEAFARQIARLYQSEDIWTRLREAALRRLERENTKAAFDRAVRNIIADQLAASTSFSLASASA